MEIESDYETVEVASVPRAPGTRVCPECDAAFMPRYGSQVCCSDDCRLARKRRLQAERHRLERGDFDRSPRVCPECGTAFEPKRKNQICCCAACAKVRAHRKSADAQAVTPSALKAERAAKARRRAAFFAARDAAFERAGLPIPKIVVRDGVRFESRGTIAGRPSGKSSLQISSKSYYYR